MLRRDVKQFACCAKSSLELNVVTQRTDLVGSGFSLIALTHFASSFAPAGRPYCPVVPGSTRL